MKISVARFVIGTVLLGGGVGLSLAVWRKWIELFPGRYSPQGAFFGFALASAPACAGVCLLTVSNPKTAVVATIVLVAVCALIQSVAYDHQYYWG
jgi:hypothetical protein